MGLYWRIEKVIRELEAASGSVVGATGAFYALRHELVTPLRRERSWMTFIFPMQAVKAGKRVVFEPRARGLGHSRSGRGARVWPQGSHLSGNYQLVQIAPWLLTKKNPIRFRFVSHKLLRLAVPFALAAAFGGICFSVRTHLSHGTGSATAFYGLSLVAVLRLSRGPLARMADAASLLWC